MPYLEQGRERNAFLSERGSNEIDNKGSSKDKVQQPKQSEDLE